jgi:hypothetical protein
MSDPVNHPSRYNQISGIECIDAVKRLEEDLSKALGERDRFLWHGKRMQKVLERIEIYLTKDGVNTDLSSLSDILLAIGVVTGKQVDWGKRLKGWFD